MNHPFMEKLEIARMYSNIAYNLSRAYSCWDHNNELKNSSKISEHPEGLAVDIKYKTKKEAMLILRGLVFAGFTRIKVYKSHIHVDMSKNKKKPKIWFDVAWR